MVVRASRAGEFQVEVRGTKSQFPGSRLRPQAERLVPAASPRPAWWTASFRREGEELESRIRAWLLRQTDFAPEFGKPGIRTQRVELEVSVQTH